jgi:hypothetical protein
MEGYFRDQPTEVCKLCYKYKGDCFEECPSTTIVDEDKKICEDKATLFFEDQMKFVYGIAVAIILL